MYSLQHQLAAKTHCEYHEVPHKIQKACSQYLYHGEETDILYPPSLPSHCSVLLSNSTISKLWRFASYIYFFLSLFFPPTCEYYSFWDKKSLRRKRTLYLGGRNKRKKKAQKPQTPEFLHIFPLHPLFTLRCNQSGKPKIPGPGYASTKHKKTVCSAHGPSKLGASSKDPEFLVDYQNRPRHVSVKKLKRQRPGSGYNPSSSAEKESNSASFWC